jgi:hypothetical protein
MSFGTLDGLDGLDMMIKSLAIRMQCPGVIDVEENNELRSGTITSRY